MFIYALEKLKKELEEKEKEINNIEISKKLLELDVICHNFIVKLHTRLKNDSFHAIIVYTLVTLCLVFIVLFISPLFLLPLLATLCLDGFLIQDYIRIVNDLSVDNILNEDIDKKSEKINQSEELLKDINLQKSIIEEKIDSIIEFINSLEEELEENEPKDIRVVDEEKLKEEYEKFINEKIDYTKIHFDSKIENEIDYVESQKKYMRKM